MTYGNYPDLSKVKKVLVVKLRHLGDVLLTTPVFTNLKKYLPEAQIDAYIYREAKPMLEGLPSINHLIVYDRKWKKRGFFYRLFKEFSLLKKIRKEGYDLVINLTEGDRGAYAAKISQAKVRVGFTPKKKWQKKLYTHEIKHTPGVKHTVERNLDAIRVLGIFPDLSERGLFFSTKEERTNWVSDNDYILIHPTSRWRFKCWPQKNMRELILWLLSRGQKVVISSGPDPLEMEIVSKITEGLDVINLSGKTTLKELGAVIRDAKLLISVDTVALHMASALKTPTVVLFGPTSDVTWGPWQNPVSKVVSQNFPCRPCYRDGCAGSKYSDCLETLPLKMVQEALLELKIFSEVRTSSPRMGEELRKSSRKQHFPLLN